jgi:hypothetical protein
MVEPRASRVLAMSEFEYGHDPGAGAVVDTAAFVVVVLQAALAVAVLLPPQAAVRKLPATSSAAQLLKFILI